MLKLYYTTTKGEDEEQQKASNSLGGYKSSNLFQNDSFNNCFGDISTYTINNNNQDQYIGLILKNEGASKTNINLYFDYPEDSYSKLYIAAVDLATDSDGFGYMENVQTFHSSPTYGTFYEANGVDNAVNLGDLAQNEAIGIWIKREMLVDTIKEDLDDFVIEDPENSDRVIQKTLNQSDTIEMVLSYD